MNYKFVKSEFLSSKKMLLYCIYAILVSVQCTPAQDYLEIDDFKLENATEELKKEINMQSQYGAVTNKPWVQRSTAEKLEVYFQFDKMSRDVRSIIYFLLSSVQEKTCITLYNDFYTIYNKNILFIKATKDTIENCFAFFEGYIDQDARFLLIKLNEECVRQMEKDLRAGRTTSKHFVDTVNDAFCK